MTNAIARNDRQAGTPIVSALTGKVSPATRWVDNEDENTGESLKRVGGGERVTAEGDALVFIRRRPKMLTRTDTCGRNESLERNAGDAIIQRQKLDNASVLEPRVVYIVPEQ